MSTFNLCPLFQGQPLFISTGGQVLANGNIYSNAAGTTTPLATYTSNTGGTSNPNPIQLDATGRLTQEIWQTGGLAYKYTVTDSNNVPVGISYDNIWGINDPTLTSVSSVIVIDSVSSADKSNAASANSAKWAYEEANAAFKQANNAYAQANAAYAQANGGVGIYSNNTLVHTGSQLNFNNTAAANISVTTAGGLVNIAISSNGATSVLSANGNTTLPSGLILQWFTNTATPGGEAGPFTTPFPTAFPNACLQVQGTPNGDGPIIVQSFNTTGVTWATGFGGATFTQTQQYFLAIGH